jgi:hypothetical protein
MFLLPEHRRRRRMEDCLRAMLKLYWGEIEGLRDRWRGDTLAEGAVCGPDGYMI